MTVIDVPRHLRPFQCSAESLVPFNRRLNCTVRDGLSKVDPYFCSIGYVFLHRDHADQVLDQVMINAKPDIYHSRRRINSF